MSEQPRTKTPLLGNTTYTRVKYAAALVLPALGALYFALAQIWNWPNAEQVTGSIAALNVFLGVLLGVSERSYDNSSVAFDGTIKLTGGKMASVEINHATEQPVIDKGVGLFKIE